MRTPTSTPPDLDSLRARLLVLVWSGLHVDTCIEWADFFARKQTKDLDSQPMRTLQNGLRHHLLSLGTIITERESVRHPFRPFDLLIH